MAMITEVRGYEGLYQVDTYGVVHSCKTLKPMKSHKDTKRGYQRVTLTDASGTRKVLYNHRLVALNFLSYVAEKDIANVINNYEREVI